MSDVQQLIICVGLAYGYAILARPFFRVPNRIGTVVATGVAVAVLFCPLLIPSEKVILRALALIACTELMFKMLDYARQCRHGSVPVAPADYLKFLVPFPPLLVVFHRRTRRSEAGVPRRDVLRVLLGAAFFAMGFFLVHVASGSDTLRSCFALDHAVKLVIFVLTIESLSQVSYGLERLARYDTRPPVEYSFLSRTVAEFWCRYNNRVHAWFDYNVFRPTGGRRAPVRGVLLAFFVSAIHHELGFAIATSRIDGYQFTFFMLQTPAVLLSRSLKRFARQYAVVGPIVAYSLTVAWMYITSIFFFHGVNRVFPFFYTSQPWLP